jgi:tRNA-dihydrouridine synthase
VNVEATRALAEATSLEIIASGGVTSLEDLRELRELEPLGVTGVIAGRALYEGRFTVAQALAVLADEPYAAAPESPAWADGQAGASLGRLSERREEEA